MTGEAPQENISIKPPAMASMAERGFEPLDPRVINLWVISDLVSYVVMLLVLLLGLLVWSYMRPRYLWGSMIGWAILTAFCLWFSFWRPPRAYRSWGYRLNERVLEIRSGFVFQHTRLLPLSRLQHVDLERGPFERMYGLASLILHTAGTHAASISLPGLDADVAVRLRDHLVEVGGDDAV